MNHTLTWDQFKSLVDQQLDEEGLTGDIELFYIDTGSYPIEIDVCTVDNELSVGIVR